MRFITFALWMALAIIVPADLLRFNSRRFARTYEKLLGFLMRESERVRTQPSSLSTITHIPSELCQWCCMVHHRCQLCPITLPPRRGHCGHSHVSPNGPMSYIYHPHTLFSLSWADTAASTFGRLYGSATRKLPARLPLLRFPLAPRKSLAGFIAATVTGTAITLGFWGFIAPMRAGGKDVTWAWDGGVRQAADQSLGAGGALGLMALAVVTGLVSGVAEALGELNACSIL